MIGFLVDIGAFNPIGSGAAYNTIAHLIGPYRIDNFAAEGKIVTTNKVAERALSWRRRPEAAWSLERTMDLVAGQLGLEPAEVRRRNMIRPDEMPYRPGILYRDGEPIVYDGGDYPGALDKALAAVGGLAAFRERQKASARKGRHLGIGIGCYTEGTGVGPFEGATVRIDPPARISCRPAPVRKVRVWRRSSRRSSPTLGRSIPMMSSSALADTAAIPMGFGTMASRSTVPCRPQSIMPANACGRRHSRLLPICWNAGRTISSCVAARLA